MEYVINERTVGKREFGFFNELRVILERVPVIILATIIIATFTAAVWMMAPMVMMITPIKKVRRRPRLSPTTATKTAPKKLGGDV
jgi:hypothetical protein